MTAGHVDVTVAVVGVFFRRAILIESLHDGFGADAASDLAAVVQQQIGFGRMTAGHIDVLPIFLGLFD